MAVIVVDASGLVLGRMASLVAQKIRAGEEVAIVNAEKALVLGNKNDIFAQYLQRYNVGSTRKGPFFPRMPDRIVRRTVRGMVGYIKPSGKEAYRRVKAYIGMPKEFASQKPVVLDKAKPKGHSTSVTVLEISRRLGAKV